MKTVFMGTPDFAVESLKGLIRSGAEIGCVITQPDRAKNRGKKIVMTPVKELAMEQGIKVLQPERIRNDEETMKFLKEYNPDLIVVTAYGQIIPKEILDLPKYGCINVHASLLPRFRGASPIQHAILAGDEETGVTIMQMEEGLDTGDMISKASIEIGDMNGEELHDALAKLGGQLLEETLPDIFAGNIHPEKQDDALSNYAGLIKKEDGKLDFENEDADYLERKIRAFDPWPSTYCIFNGQNMKVKKAQFIDKDYDLTPGTVIKADDEGIDVVCKNGVLRIKELQLPGKKAMETGPFLRGNKLEKGEVLK